MDAADWMTGLTEKCQYSGTSRMKIHQDYVGSATVPTIPGFEQTLGEFPVAGEFYLAVAHHDNPLVSGYFPGP